MDRRFLHTFVIFAGSIGLVSFLESRFVGWKFLIFVVLMLVLKPTRHLGAFYGFSLTILAWVVPFAKITIGTFAPFATPSAVKLLENILLAVVFSIFTVYHRTHLEIRASTLELDFIKAGFFGLMMIIGSSFLEFLGPLISAVNPSFEKEHAEALIVVLLALIFMVLFKKMSAYLSTRLVIPGSK